MPPRVPVTWPLGVLAEGSGLSTWGHGGIDHLSTT